MYSDYHLLFYPKCPLKPSVKSAILEKQRVAMSRKSS